MQMQVKKMNDLPKVNNPNSTPFNWKNKPRVARVSVFKDKLEIQIF